MGEVTRPCRYSSFVGADRMPMPGWRRRAASFPASASSRCSARVPHRRRFRPPGRGGRSDMTTPSLGPFGELAIRHWKAQRPKMYRDMKAKGTLEYRAHRAEMNALDFLADQVANGVNYPDAKEMALAEYILLPSEDDVPELGGP